jgi:hypothetical protein
MKAKNAKKAITGYPHPEINPTNPLISSFL